MRDTASEPHLVLGTAQLTQRYGQLASQASAVPEPAALLSVAASLGIDHLDTAPAYGAAERTIGASGWRGEVHTKIAYRKDPRASLAESLTALRRPTVEVLYLHDANELTRPDGTVLQRAADLVGSGAGALGASIYDVEQLEAALANQAIRVLQVPLSVLDRRFLGAPLRKASGAGVRVYVRSVFLQGTLLARPSQLPAALGDLAVHVSCVQAIAEGHGVTPECLALAWVRAQRGLTGVIIGAHSARELAELARAWRCDAPADALAALDALEMPAANLVDPRQWKRA